MLTTTRQIGLCRVLQIMMLEREVTATTAADDDTTRMIDSSSIVIHCVEGKDRSCSRIDDIHICVTFCTLIHPHTYGIVHTTHYREHEC